MKTKLYTIDHNFIKKAYPAVHKILGGVNREEPVCPEASNEGLPPSTSAKELMQKGFYSVTGRKLT